MATTSPEPLQRDAAPTHGGSLGRKLPPLATIVVALAMAVFVLPSSLNVPQSNPQTVAEFAPIPPTDEDTPPVNSNSDSFGLGGSDGLSDEGEGEGAGELGSPTTLPPLPDAPPDPLEETPDTLPQEKNSTTKRCVGNPPRQTEDPLAPPCVGSFNGDNGGATYQGVTAEEIVILIYHDVGGTLQTSKGATETSPGAGTYVDLDAEPSEDDFITTRNNRIWMRYFNDRFQTYGRRVHAYEYFSGAETAEARRADASDNVSGKKMPKPFAVIDQAQFNGNREAYRDAMARRGVMQFLSLAGIPGAQLAQYKPLVWGFFPDIEHLADLYIDYICKRVAPYPVSRTGNPGEPGRPRVYGMWRTDDPAFTNLSLLRDYVVEGIGKCPNPVKIVAEHTFSVNGFVVEATNVGDEAQLAVADFRSKGVTTILQPGGIEAKLSFAGAAQSYKPELFLLGDGTNDDIGSASNQEPTFQTNVRGIVSWPLTGRLDEEPDYVSFRDAAGSDYPRRDIQYATEIYRDLFQLFRAIQVAGPRLVPTQIDAGFHAIPRVASQDPKKVAGFYDVGDYSYVKDAAVQWWDSSTQNPYAQAQGCYRYVEGGKRYLARQFTPGDDFASGRATPADPCSGTSNSFKIST